MHVKCTAYATMTKILYAESIEELVELIVQREVLDEHKDTIIKLIKIDKRLLTDGKG